MAERYFILLVCVMIRSQGQCLPEFTVGLLFTFPTSAPTQAQLRPSSTTQAASLRAYVAYCTCMMGGALEGGAQLCLWVAGKHCKILHNQ